ncbi:uncharacterized protein IL334_001803 [Kwoniella shivajii]|uniref:Uncharacterized protein n=1 Tax=Kwoniella shivajii TaxID=564305 RepID=A0ABZ1CSX9_9TREE|nr:hypothetical protein IL334_001803 [Kwoniella shivajii]
MPASPSPYLTPPPTLPPTACSSRRSSLADNPLPHQRLLRQRPDSQHALPNVRIRLPALSTIPDRSGGEDGEDEEDDGSGGRADKRRRTNKGGKAVEVIPSPRRDKGEGSSTSPSHHATQSSSLATRHGRGNGSTLAPIKPIGFAASREARRDDGNQAIPSPVVMGFDFKAVDEDQLKTVRDTISIKEQQQALIAARRREVAQSQPSTPKELTFRGWAPKDNIPPESVNASNTPRGSISGSTSGGAAPNSGGGVGRRREKTRDKVEKMSIVTSATERDVVPGSKSAPLNQGLASQQESPREPPSGSQTALPPHILPPLHGYNHHANGLTDPRTAPISHSRTRNGGEDHEFARQQGPYYGVPQSRPLARPYESQQNLRGPTAASDRRNFSVPSNNLQPPSSSSRYESRRPSGSGPGGPSAQGHSDSPISPRVPRETFLAPFHQLYDLYTATDHLRYNLQDLLHRYEGAYQSQLSSMSEFKNTANASNTLLGNLQASADSLKDMVRYEVERSNTNKDREIEELRERLKRLEEKIEEKKE